jgi:hypothetical protein
MWKKLQAVGKNRSMKSSKTFWQAVFIIGLFLSVLAFYQTVQQGNAMGIALLRSKWVFLLGLNMLVAVACSLILVKLRDEQGERIILRLNVESGSGFGRQAVGPLAVLVSLGSFLLIKYRLLGGFIPQAGPSVWILWWLTLGASAALKAGYRRSWAQLFALAFLAQGVALSALSYFPSVSTYPFSLGWSEASRYYYGSLVFASRIYGERVPLSILHPTRYFLQSIPFLVDGLPIWAHRLWQVILWVGMTAVTAFLFVRRLRLGGRLLGMLVAMWFFLYLLQGAVYYHLQIMIWIILLGVSVRHPWRSLVAVVAASIWAGMSRVNWFPMPAMLAIGLYLLEEPATGYRTFWHYLIKPAAWLGLGILTALASQSLYIYWSGNGDNLLAFGSSFTSDLLWERLWANPTFPLGVVPGTAIVSAPIIAIIIYSLRGRLTAWHPIRLSGLAGMLAVLFAGGLMVSVKIGGGGDLHNMDAYMTLLGIIGGYLYFDRAVLDKPAAGYRPPLLISYFAMLVPVGFAILSVTIPKPVDFSHVAQDIQAIQEATAQAVTDGEEVLFINQRHLLADKSITHVPLVPEYELVTLNEMAMSNNEPYLEMFYSDLREHRFGVIVASAQFTDFQRSDYPFAAENNTWALRIARPLVCEYQVETTLSDGITIMVPREKSACP